MASKVTNEDIIRMNELYFKYKTYAAVAREVGFSASTVKKYIIPNWRPAEQQNIVRFEWSAIPDFDDEIFKGIDNYGDLCVLTEREQQEISELWRELSI